MKVVIAGAGEVGFHIASRLALENKDVVIIDNDADAIRRISDSLDVQVISGSGSSPVVLEEAGIKDAEILLAVTNKDETNLVACMVADIISPATKKLARIRDADYDKYHSNFSDSAPHISTIINPDVEVVRTIDRLMTVPGAVDVGEFADGNVRLVGIRLDEDSQMTGIPLFELSQKTGKSLPLIASVIRNDELIIPRGSDVLMPDDTLYFISKEENLEDFLKVFNKYAKPARRALIVGGGRIGFRLAALLEEKSIYTKIIEKNPDRCALLAEQLNKAVVLQGDGSDQDLLAEENIQEMDVAVTLTDDEETNILASLLAKRMGVPKAITKISKFSYFSLMPTIGIDQVVDPRLSAINTILRHIRRGKVLSSKIIKGEGAEVVEAVAMETSDIVGKPLKDISFPKGVLLICIIRENDITIPSGESIIQPGDRIIIFAKRDAIPKMEKILEVKLEYF
ncbi:Trk system potassium transporter TrkA [Desulfococcaceae bacterium HSG8]|nr:Trk system potassium transporter TrkA [Desulfococcaceae bacterium HSG8]